MSMLENNYNLPEMCFSVHEKTGKLICIRFGIEGYFKSNLSTSSKEKNAEIAKQMNSHLGITLAQKRAMIHGSMFGWDTPGTNPQNYKNIKETEAWHERVYEAAKELRLEVALKDEIFEITATADMNTKHTIKVNAYNPKGLSYFLIDLEKAIRNFNIPKEIYSMLSEDGYYHTSYVYRYDMKFLYKALETVVTRFQMLSVLLGGYYSSFRSPWYKEEWTDTDITMVLDRLNKEEVINLPRTEYGKAVLELRKLLQKAFEESSSDRNEKVSAIIENHFKKEEK